MESPRTYDVPPFSVLESSMPASTSSAINLECFVKLNQHLQRSYRVFCQTQSASSTQLQCILKFMHGFNFEGLVLVPLYVFFQLKQLVVSMTCVSVCCDELSLIDSFLKGYSQYQLGLTRITWYTVTGMAFPYITMSFQSVYMKFVLSFASMYAVGSPYGFSFSEGWMVG